MCAVVPGREFRYCGHGSLRRTMQAAGRHMVDDFGALLFSEATSQEDLV